MYNVFHKEDSQTPYIIGSFKTLKEDNECLEKHLKAAQEDHCVVEKEDKYKYCIYDNLYVSFDEIYIEKDDKNKSQNNQQLTLFNNYQNQTIMASPKQTKKWALICENEVGEGFHVVETFESFIEAKKALDKEEKELIKDKADYNRDGNAIYIDTRGDYMTLKIEEYKKPKTIKDDKNKSQNNQQLTLFNNSQNQKTMPTARTAQKKDGFGRTQGNPYQTKVKGKPYMKVPEKMVTLPKGNAFITARKHMELSTTYVDKNGNTRHNKAVYVLGYSNLNGKTQSGKTRRHWFVARQFNVGGTPKLSLYRYSGYDRSLARRVFMEIPCTESFWLKREQHQGGEWGEIWVKGNAITAQEVVTAKVKSRARYRENNNPWQSPRLK